MKIALALSAAVCIGVAAGAYLFRMDRRRTSPGQERLHDGAHQRASQIADLEDMYQAPSLAPYAQRVVTEADAVRLHRQALDRLDDFGNFGHPPSGVPAPEPPAAVYDWARAERDVTGVDLDDDTAPRSPAIDDDIARRARTALDNAPLPPKRDEDQ